MHSEPQPAAITPLFIPEDVSAAFAEEASQVVSRSRAHRQPPPAPHPSPDPMSVRRATEERRLIIAAVALALTGLASCVIWWTKLAFDTRSATWTTLAFAAAAVWVIGTAVALSFRFPPLEGRQG